MENLMKLFKKERTTTYFRDYALWQIRIAYRIMEYLSPDSVFPPQNLSPAIMDLFLKRDVVSAVNNILMEVSFECGSSMGYCEMQKEAVEFATELLNEYFKKMNKNLMSEREQLLIRLGEIDNQIGAK